MDWIYTLTDALQLIIPWACLLLLTAVVLAYSVLHHHFKEPLYLSGLYISVVAVVYVLFEALVILSGWTEWTQRGPYFHRIGQLASIWFPPTLMYFAWTCWQDSPTLKKVIPWLGYVALAVAAGVSLMAFVVPDSFISSTIDQSRTVLSPGDLSRGAVGFLYGFRDLFLGAYMMLFSLIALSRLLRGPKDRKLFFILLGLFLSFWGAVDDMFFYQLGSNFFLNSVRFSRVSVGITLMMFFFLTALLNEFLKAQRELKRTYTSLQKSEEKYRVLSECADQAIFSLSSDMKFHSYNQRAEQLFSLFHHGDKEFGEILRIKAPETSHMVGDILEEKIDQIKESMNTSFRTLVQDPRTGEPEEYHFEFNPIPGEQGEFIGRASRQGANRLSGYVDFEKLKLNIDNYILVIDDVGTRLTHALPRYLDHSEVLHIKMGLQEIIINAIEHGNLGITFEEKSRTMMDGSYRDLIKERQSLSPYKDRTVCIEYVLTNDKVKYLICDQGEGFDHRKKLAEVKQKVEEEMLPHGRGIRMTQAIFDEVTYNRKGNQVLLEKNLQ